jgi:hypothetical protein
VVKWGRAFCLVLIFGLGVTATPEPGWASGTPPTPFVCRATPHLRCLGRANAGTVTRATVGQQVKVTFSNSGLAWRVVPTTIKNVLRPVGAPLRHDGSFATTYDAIGPGRVVIELSGAPICVPRTPCPQFVVVWRTTILVVQGR